ncbi:MAG: GNAT family N-acetyltransferase [Desulfomonile sp.]|jgi:RimJ/RimL family protein N-acetyltransferase
MLTRYPKEIVSADGIRIILRPVMREDEKSLSEFFSRIPEEERWFRRHNLAEPAVLREWIEDLDQGRIIVIVAVNTIDNEIIANVRLHRRPTECLRHLAHLRIIVDPRYRHRRIGTQILLNIIELAKDMGIEKLVAEFVAGIEETAVKGARKLDFFEQAVLKDYVKDSQGNYHNLTIMVKTLHQGMSDF